MEECQIVSHPNVQLTVATRRPTTGNDLKHNAWRVSGRMLMLSRRLIVSGKVCRDKTNWPQSGADSSAAIRAAGAV